MIRSHHERWDGTGYPERLAGQNIPLLSRMIAIVDAYDSMVNDRAYRKGLEPAQAQEEIRRNAGTQFDPILAEQFLKMLEEPTPKTLFLLLTDSPDQLLPTIVSRCQSVDVSDGSRRELEEPWRGRVLDIVSDGGIAGVLEKCVAAGKLAALLGELGDEAEKLVDEESAHIQEGAGERLSEEELNALYSSRYREFRDDFVQTLVGWFRDMMAVKAGGGEAPVYNADRIGVIRERAAKLTLAQCFRNIEAVEELAVSFGRNIQEEPLLARFTDRVSFGTEGAA